MSEAETLTGLLVALFGGILLALSVSRPGRLVQRSPFVVAIACAGGMGFLMLALFGVVLVERYWKESPDWSPSPVPVAAQDLPSGEPIDREMIASRDAPRWAASWVPGTPEAIEGRSPSIPIAKSTPVFPSFLAPRDPDFCQWLKAPRAPQPEPEPGSNAPEEDPVLERSRSRLNH